MRIKKMFNGYNWIFDTDKKPYTVTKVSRDFDTKKIIVAATTKKGFIDICKTHIAEKSREPIFVDDVLEIGYLKECINTVVAIK